MILVICIVFFLHHSQVENQALRTERDALLQASSQNLEDEREAAALRSHPLNSVSLTPTPNYNAFMFIYVLLHVFFTRAIIHIFLLLDTIANHIIEKEIHETFKNK